MPTARPARLALCALRPRLLRASSCSAILALLGACYSGVSAFDPEAEGGGPGGDDPSGADDGPSDPDGIDVSESYVPEAGQIRLLSADEYKNTIRDLLGVEVSSELQYGEVGSGYDNSGEGQLGESLFSILYTEAQRVAEQYVATELAGAFDCFEPGSATGAACVETIVDGLGRRAFRRPVDPQTRQQLLDFVADATPKTDEPDQVMELLVTRLLMSPRFLYRTEVGQNLADDPSLALLDPYERASLVSYTLVGSMPDEPLLADAEADRLDLPRIREHVRRLMDTDAGRAQLVKFFEQWLRVSELEAMARAPEDYAKFVSAEQAQTLRDEFNAFIDHVVLDDAGTLDDLLTRNVTWVNQHTAPLYGGSSQSDALEPLTLDAQQRGGVLTLASVMAVHSSSAEIHRDKPIRRGLLIQSQLLCGEIGLPSGIDVQSAAAEVLDEVPNFDELTTREQLELIMNQDQLCVDCHQQFMPYGYLWGNFDALGQYQIQFGDRPIDAAVEGLLLDGTARSYGGIMELVPDLAGSDQVARCVTTNVAQYASGQAGGELVDFMAEQITPVFVGNDRDLLQLFEDILTAPELYIREGR
ncbi:MAG: DUF1592 domain-containing protein [Myxococcota bacterium]